MRGRGREEGEGAGNVLSCEGQALQGVAARRKGKRRGMHGCERREGPWNGRSRGGEAWRGQSM